MSCRFVSTSAICLCVISIPAYPQTHARAPVRRAQGVRLTPDGHPDLQGNWTNNFATPLERPKGFENRPLLTDEEVAALNRRAELSFKDGHPMVVPSGQSLLTLLDDPSHFASAPTYDSTFFTPMAFENRTSLITDPPNGRLPDYTPAGRLRRTAAVTDVQSVQDLPTDTRCITFGMPRIAGVAGTPSAGVYAYYQIVQ